MLYKLICRVRSVVSAIFHIDSLTYDLSDICAAICSTPDSCTITTAKLRLCLKNYMNGRSGVSHSLYRK